MLEKIGLPPKPSQRGNNWVIDASHCQGCSSQFTFINRKHHCRRCGGLFCNSCTNQRMVLRGQGDSPVRICEPCKQLEEAARFEMRYGSRSRVGKGSSRSSMKSENENLSEILGNDRKESFASGVGSSSKSVSMTERSKSVNAPEGVSLDGGEKLHRSTSVDAFSHPVNEKEPTSPEDLRRQAVEEKKKYKTLKGEGKSDEALRAFKRGKELERQADALEISLRRNRRKALLSPNAEEHQIKDETGGSRKGNKIARLQGKEKDDLAAELRELGWSDMDLHNVDKKGTNITLEGEFSSLLGEISEKTKKDKGSDSIDKSQVLAHKKKALALKREGNLAEAKEELKRAKVLEKQLEEQELLAAAEDSDDDLSALIHSMDSDKQELSSKPHEQVHDFDLSSLLGAPDQIIDGNFDVTEEDMEDPEIEATLKSLGWTDDDDGHKSFVRQGVSADKEVMSNEILSLKREALTQKRAGNVSEAMALLKKAKLLERDLENFEPQEGNFAKDATTIPKGSTYQTANQLSMPIMASDENINATKNMEVEPAPRKSKLMIQKELLGLKKKALALRREGRLDEAEEELKKGRILEKQLEEMDKDHANVKPMSVAATTQVPNFVYDNLPVGGEEGEDVTDQDMNDPSYLFLLKNLGWQEGHTDHPESVSSESRERNNSPQPISKPSVPQAAPVVTVMGPRRSKAELQRELLGLKRKALALRRQGESEEAEKVLRKAKDIEAQMAEMEQPIEEVKLDISTQNENIAKSTLGSADKEDDAEFVTEKDMQDPAMLSILKNLGGNDEEHETVTVHGKLNENAGKSVHSDTTSITKTSATGKRSKGEIQRELLNLKRKALALRRKGETQEAEEVLNMAKVLEGQLEELDAPKQANLQAAAKDEEPNNFDSPSNREERGNGVADMGTSIGMPQPASGLSSRFELATGKGSMISDKANYGIRNSDLLIPLNSPLVESSSVPPPGDSGNLIDLLTGDDWRGSRMPAEKHENLDPRNEYLVVYESNPFEELASVARKDDVRSEKQENIVHVSGVDDANPVKEHASQTNETSIKQEILARKRKAVALKREGKLVEAREELRQAKFLEKGLSQDDTKSATTHTHEPVTASNASSSGQKERISSPNVSPKPLSSRDRFKLQQESLAHKRQALKLRREGKTEEADAEFELAKSLEAQLEESSAHDSSSAADSSEAESDLGVEDFLDPQLLSALRAIGIADAGISPRVPDASQPLKPSVATTEVPNQERIHLEEQIKAEKVKALNLKRSGKQAEALDALRKAKFLEKKLNSM